MGFIKSSNSNICAERDIPLQGSSFLRISGFIWFAHTASCNSSAEDQPTEYPAIRTLHSRCRRGENTSESPRKLMPIRIFYFRRDDLIVLRLTFSYGESHCRSVGCIVDGCPPGMELTERDIQPQMTRRRPGQSALTTPRNEKDRVEIQSGTEFGVTLGTPIAMIVRNEDQRPKDYGNSTMDLYPRPSHADFTYLEKYGVKASSGGGRSSARETIG